MRSPNKRLRLEELNDRIVPATWAVPWDDAGHLTVSFAPDGTDVGGKPNTLSKDMKADGYATAADWQAVVWNALNTWSAAAGVRFQSHSDAGTAFGTPGLVQGDTRFGDIRIASRPLTSNLAAETSPFSWSGSTWSGDIVFNSNVPFSSDGRAGTTDLYSVALHEVGHALGLGGNSDPTSAMCEGYTTHTGLSAADVQAVQALYGTPLPPASPPPVSPPPLALSTAAQLTAVSAGSSVQFYGNFSGTLKTRSQSDDYAVTAPKTDAGAQDKSAPMNLIVYVRAANTSPILTPQLSVTDAAGQAVPFQVISNAQGWVSVQALGVTPGATYHLKVYNSTLSSKQTLSYRMGVNFNQDPPVARDLVAANTLSASKTTDTGTLTLTESRLMSFGLNSTWSGDTTVRMTVTDATGKVVAQLVSGPNALPPTLDVFLDAGTYTVSYQAFSPSGKKVSTVKFSATVEVLNDPVGMYAPAPQTMAPQTTAPTVPPTSPPTSPPPASIVPPLDYYYTGMLDLSSAVTYLYYY